MAGQTNTGNVLGTSSTPLGATVIPFTGSLPAGSELDKLQVGDIVCFDKDTTDVVAGQIDHVGFYFGLDTAGGHRFISSRKAPDGPTFSNAGGDSLLDASSTAYGTTFRSARRY